MATHVEVTSKPLDSSNYLDLCGIRRFTPLNFNKYSKVFGFYENMGQKRATFNFRKNFVRMELPPGSCVLKAMRDSIHEQRY
jgi:hypothetical protein